jgi:hypothetical protein
MTANTAVAITDQLAGKPDVSRLGNTAMSSVAPGPLSILPTTFGEMMEFSKLMAMSKGSIPACLRGSPADCLAVTMDAMAAKLSPFALAKDAYKVGDIIAYGAKSTVAMLYALAPLEGRLQLSWEGEGEALKCTVTGKFRGDPNPKTLTVELKTISVRNSPLWKQQARVQLAYWAQRAWARLYAPEATLGAPCIDDIQEEQAMRDVTPAGERPRTATAQLQAFAAQAMEAEPEDYAEPEVTHTLLSLDGEVIHETKSSVDWLERFEAALKKSPDPTKLWALNETTAEWAGDQTERGDEILFRLRDTYLPKEGDQSTAATAPDQGTATAEPSEWDDELAELQRIGLTCTNFGQWTAFVEDHEPRIAAMQNGSEAHKAAWAEFAKARMGDFQAKPKGAK